MCVTHVPQGDNLHVNVYADHVHVFLSAQVREAGSPNTAMTHAQRDAPSSCTSLTGSGGTFPRNVSASLDREVSVASRYVAVNLSYNK